MARGVVWIAVVAWIVASLLTAVGCGGDAATSASLPKGDFVERADAICQKWLAKRDQALAPLAERVARAEQEGKGISTKLQEEATLAPLQPFEEATKELTELGLPKGGERQAEALIDARERVAAEVAGEPLVSRASAPFKKVEKIAEETGVQRCAIF